jgi:hypothetical protein
MTSTFKSLPDCPVCNHASTSSGSSTIPKDNRPSWQRATHFKEHLSIITDIPETQLVEKSAFSSDTASSEHFIESVQEQHDDPPTPVTVVGELPEEFQDWDDPLEPKQRRREQAVLIKTKVTPRVPSPDPFPPRSTSLPFVQDVPYFRREQDLERNLPQTPHTARTPQSSRSIMSRILLPFWTTRKEEIPPQKFKEMFPNEPYPPIHDEALPHHHRSQWFEPQPEMKPWNPLRIIKNPKPEHDNDHQEEMKKRAKKRKKDRRCWCLLILIIIILLLLGDAIFLNVRVAQLDNTITSFGLIPGSKPSSTAGSSPTNNPQLSTEAQSCLTQFQVNAPSSPTSYACSTCLPILQSVPSSFLTAPSTSTATSQNITNAIQFCGLQSIFQAASTGNGGNPLGNVGWLQNVAFCTWDGVTCSGDGKVAQL